ncbi:DoxX family protein [Trinickia terrae]|uniref:DoxX family protein n=1 Tax=Trinickia terrae TaxID=2571161 RepID=A0A4U1I9B3_9BURK|nr:DoxX family protein [Trinickia terrae]TKC90068.1 DoxX family protein [Trinickia terrae]
MAATIAPSVRPGKLLRRSLWGAQIVVALVFCAAGVVKCLAPMSQLSGMLPWAGQLPPVLVRMLGLIDLAGGLGIFLPSLTRIKPSLTVQAAFGCIALQLSAIAFHLSRGEVSVLPLNFVLLPLCIFVFWGRGKRAPILPAA